MSYHVDFHTVVSEQVSEVQNVMRLASITSSLVSIPYGKKENSGDALIL